MNDIKEDRYREAYERIDSAISSGFSFEAIAIVESVLSDRICSFLCSVNGINESKIYQCSFYQLIMLWRFTVINPGSIWEECSDLIERVDKWRKLRNDCIHKFVKFPHNKAKVDTTEEFLEKAKKAATDGKQLSADVYNWRRRQTVLKIKYSKSVADISNSA